MKYSTSSSVDIKLNGEFINIDVNHSILQLLEKYKINKNSVVVELNKTIIPKDNFEKIILKENDEIEVVTFVGGG